MRGNAIHFGALARAGAFLAGVARGFYYDQCLLRAAALAYTSLLSIVPLLAVMFAVLKGLGAQDRLEPLLLSRLSLDKETADLIIQYVDRTNIGTIGALGAATLLVTVISVLGTIEASFNAIWRVRHSRSPWRKVSDYLGVVLLTPFLLLAAMAITSAAHVQEIVAWIRQTSYVGELTGPLFKLSSTAINVVGIGVLYAVMPNRRPAWGSLALSALVTGAAWQGVQWGYVAMQVGVARYNAIYGALAQLPVTLVWLYFSWTVILAGAELAARLELGPAASGRAADPQAIALHLMLCAADAFERGEPGVEPTRAARRLRVDLDQVSGIVESLRDFGWVISSGEEPARLVLARAPARVELGRLAELAAGERLPRRLDARAQAALGNARAASGRVWDEWTLADVLAGDSRRGL